MHLLQRRDSPDNQQARLRARYGFKRDVAYSPCQPRIGVGGIFDPAAGVARYFRACNDRVGGKEFPMPRPKSKKVARQEKINDPAPAIGHKRILPRRPRHDAIPVLSYVGWPINFLIAPI